MVYLFCVNIDREIISILMSKREFRSIKKCLFCVTMIQKILLKSTTKNEVQLETLNTHRN